LINNLAKFDRFLPARDDGSYPWLGGDVQQRANSDDAIQWAEDLGDDQ